MNQGRAIGVVIPVFNRERLIADALRSVLEQTAPPSSLVVVDDGLTDQTARRVEEFFASARLIRQPNAGVAAVRSAGIEAAWCFDRSVSYQPLTPRDRWRRLRSRLRGRSTPPNG